MAVKTAINGVIVLEHNDKVAKGSNNYRVEAVTISGPPGTVWTLYASDTGSGSLIASGTSGSEPLHAYIGGCIPTGGGLYYNDEAGGTTCRVYVK